MLDITENNTHQWVWTEQKQYTTVETALDKQLDDIMTNWIVV